MTPKYTSMILQCAFSIGIGSSQSLLISTNSIEIAVTGIIYVNIPAVGLGCDQTNHLSMIQGYIVINDREVLTTLKHISNLNLQQEKKIRHYKKH